MKAYIPKIAIVLFSLAVPALAGGWQCNGKNFKEPDARRQANHWVQRQRTTFSEFSTHEGVPLCYFELGEGTQPTESKTGYRGYCDEPGNLYEVRYLDEASGQWKPCTYYGNDWGNSDY